MKFKITVLQMMSTLVFGGFTYYQTRMIDALGRNRIEHSVPVITTVLLVLFLLLEMFEHYVREKEFAKQSARVKSNAARAFLTQSMSNHAEKNEEQHISYFANEIGAVLSQNIYLRFYIQKQFLMMCVSLVLLFVLSKECSIVVLLVAAGFGAVVQKMSKKFMGNQEQLQKQNAAFVETITELHNGFHEIHVNQMETLAENDFREADTNLEQAQYTYCKSRIQLETLGIGQNMFLYILVLIVGGVLAAGGRAGIGVFVVAAELMVQILNEWSGIMKLYGLVRGSGALRKNLDAYIKSGGKEYRKVSQENDDILLETENLTFGYGTDEKILSDITLSIHRGKKYLITGESGCGKSTLLELLAGHRISEDGQVVYYTDKIAYIPQKPFLFRGTLKENLVFKNDVDAEAMNEILKKVGLDIALDFMIEEEGNNLSGGQKARIALARALLTAPDLLLADEVTANLDSALGKQVEEMLLTDYPQMALCTVAHKVYCPGQYDVELRIYQHKVVEG